MTNPIRVLIVDDHGITRAGLKFYLEQDSEIVLVGEASDGQEALALCAAVTPDVVVMDFYMPLLDGIESSKMILANHPHIKIIILTAHMGKNEVSSALGVGIKGYCLKDVSNQRLLSAIHSVANGDLWVDSSLYDNFLGILPGQNPAAESNTDQSHELKSIAKPAFSLTERELEVLNLIVAGKTNLEIASVLFLSVDTIKSHLKTIMSKMNVNDRTQAAVKAVREGLTE